MSRTISIDELNIRLDQLIREYNNTAEEYFQEIGDETEGNIYLGKASAIRDLKNELNEPKPVIDVSENIQQTVAVIEANKIINDKPDKDEL